MDHRRPIPGEIRPVASATLVGVLSQAPKVRELTRNRGKFCEATLQVGTQDFPVWAFGACAEQLDGMAGGVALKVFGNLSQQEWTAANQQAQSRTVLRADRIEVLAPPVGTKVLGEDVP